MAQSNSQAPKQPRTKTLADEVYNTRRRLNRAAARYERDAKNAVGTAKKAMEKAASELRKKAESTYVKNSVKPGATKKEVRAAQEKIINALGDFSKKQTAGGKRTRKPGTEEYTQDLTHVITNTTSGAIFYASTISLWRNVGYHDRDAAILKAFNEKIEDREFNSILEVMEYLGEATGVDYFAISENEIPGDDERYTNGAAAGVDYVTKLQS